MMSKAATLFAALSAVLSVVNAHGSVNPFIAGGQTYVGPIPGSGSDQDTPVRAISTLEPINDVNSPSMACGPGASPSAKVTAEVNAGDDVQFGWRSGVSTIPWGHNLGPVMLYAYKCPGAAADCQPPTGAEWFLIDAAGADPNAAAVPDSTGWVQARFHVNMTVPVKIPAGMPNGDYLFRHEIIALHRGADIGGAEFYVSCTQVKVSGGANGTPQSAGAKFVAHPGAYKATDPGIHVNVFGDFNINNYQMPGPEVFTGNGNGNGGTVNTGGNPSGAGTPPSTSTSNGDGDYSTSSSQPPAATPSAGSGNGAGSGGSCKVVKSRKAKRNMSKRTMHQRQQAHIAGLAGRKYPARMQY